MASLHPSNPYYNATQHVDRSRPNDNVDLLSDSIDAVSPPRHPLRSQSIATSTPVAPPVQPFNPSSQQRKTSVDYQKPRNPTSFRTRSIGGPFGGVYFEREIDTSPPNDDEIIIATVRITDSFRRASVEENADLPARPPRRGFIKRVTTRVSSPTDACRYTALKMPRKDYKKYFARDREGKYAGTDPEREWGEDELQRMFSRFQDMPLRSIPGPQEFGEGERAESAGGHLGEGVGANGSSPNDVFRTDSAISEMDVGWATARAGYDNGADKRNPTVVWPGSIWT